MKASEKITRLRELMKEKGMDAFIIPSSDPHISEYPAAHWKSRAWISGFTGSAGTIVITANKAGLWTDSRYFLQAELQLKDSGISLFKDGLPETPSLKDWLASELPGGSCIGIDGDVYAASEVQLLKTFFEDYNIRLETAFKPFDLIWNNRPTIPSDKIFILPEEFSGISAREKIDKVLKEVQLAGAEVTVLASLDAIAWLFNIRGNDVIYNPVAVCYAVVSAKEAVLFIHPEKLTVEAIDYLKAQSIILADYNKIFDYVKKIPAGQRVLVNTAKINYSLYSNISGIIKEVAIHPVDMLKAVKNKTEINGIKNALKRDGVALTKFHLWLEKALESGKKVTELDVSS